MIRAIWIPVLSSCITSAHAQCTNPIWSPEFGAPGTGLASTGYTLRVFDPDGLGPAPEELYVGGGFASAGGLQGTRGIARWNGVRWADVGGGLGPSGFTAVLATFDPDGPGPGLPRLARVGNGASMWDGVQWQSLPGLPAFTPPTGLIEFDADGPGPGLPRLVACGADEFSVKVVEWNGSTWQPLPQPPGFMPRALAVFDEDGAGPAVPSLFIAMDGGGGLLKLVGNQWEVVGGGLIRSGQYLCNALTVVDLDGPGAQRPVLVAGGEFLTAGTVPSQGVVAWTGSEWLPMPLATTAVESFAAVDYTLGTGAPTLYAFAFGVVVRWVPSTQTWALAGADGMYVPLPGARYELAAYRGSGEQMPSLYLTGLFTDLDGVPSNHFARLRCQNCYANCDLSAGQPPLTANDFTCFINKFAVADPYANCDGSTGSPMLTANDFTCFLNKFVVGCP